MSRAGASCLGGGIVVSPMQLSKTTWLTVVLIPKVVVCSGGTLYGYE